MVGRDQELALLLERWAQAKAGEGQGVLLVGEAGIGKSRVGRALLDAVAEEPHTRIRYQCSPYHTDSALWPVIQQLGHAAGISTDDTTDTKLDRLEGLLDRAGGHDAAPLIADLLGLDAAARYGELQLTPQTQRARTLDALVGQLLGLAARQPVLLVLEDAHWIDPTTLEMIGQALDRIADRCVLILLTSRPDNQPALAGHPHVTRLTLNRLGRAGVEAIVARLAGDHLPGQFIDAIIARTDGVPLFVEELTKAVLETGETSIPVSLHDSLMARLDRIPEVKEVAQIAGCIGREFDHILLAAIADKPAPTLATALERLTTAELVFRRGTPPQATYTFKHALVHDAAYQSLLKSRRQQLHVRIAEVLEQQFPDVRENQPEVLARHLTDAGLAERAIPYWRRAGELVAGRSANLEAIGHLSKGLELTGALPSTDQRVDDELTLRLAIGGPLMAIKGYSSPEVEQNYGRARELCERLGRSAELFPVLRGLWNCYFPRAEIQRASELATRLVDLAEEQDTPLDRAHACRAQGSTSFAVGRLVDAAEQLGRGIALDIAVEDLSEHRAHALLHGEHPGLYCRIYLAWALWFLGYPDQALERANEAIDLGQRLAQPSNIAVASGFAAVLASWRREFAVARMRAETTIEIANEHHLPMRLGFGTMGRGAALIGLGLQAEGIAQIRAGLANWNATGARLMEPQWFGFIAEAHLQAGQLDEARSALDRAAAAVEATGECSYQAELHRLRGAVLTRAGEFAEAAAWLRRAIDTAQGQRAKSLELRAATSLARLWVDQNKRAQALDLLAPIYGWFTEGFDTADLKDAKALLDELR
jgi:predicted ATPase